MNATTRDPLVRFKNTTWHIYEVIRPVAGIASFIALAVVVVFQFHAISETQIEAKQTAQEAALLSLSVARNQVTGHDSVVKACIQARDSQITEALNHEFQAENDQELANSLGKQYPRVARLLTERAAAEIATASVIRGDLTELCQYQFEYPPKTKK